MTMRGRTLASRDGSWFKPIDAWWIREKKHALIVVYNIDRSLREQFTFIYTRSFHFKSALLKLQFELFSLKQLKLKWLKLNQ